MCSPCSALLTARLTLHCDSRAPANPLSARQHAANAGCGTMHVDLSLHNLNGALIWWTLPSFRLETNWKGCALIDFGQSASASLWSTAAC